MTIMIVTDKKEYRTIDVVNDEYEDTQLTPNLARKCAIHAKLIPCYVTDGTRIYRVTRRAIVQKDLYKLPYVVTNRIIELLTIESEGI